MVPALGLPADSTFATDLPVELNDVTYQTCREDFVMRFDGSTCLQLQNKEGGEVRREDDPLEVAQQPWACNDAGIEVRVQVNESITPQKYAGTVYTSFHDGSRLTFLRHQQREAMSSPNKKSLAILIIMASPATIPDGPQYINHIAHPQEIPHEPPISSVACQNGIKGNGGGQIPSRQRIRGRGGA